MAAKPMTAAHATSATTSGRVPPDRAGSTGDTVFHTTPAASSISRPSVSRPTASRRRTSGQAAAPASPRHSQHAATCQSLNVPTHGNTRGWRNCSDAKVLDATHA